jgi:hypothetical protein
MIVFSENFVVFAQEVMVADLETNLINYNEYLSKLSTELNVLQHKVNILRLNLTCIDYHSFLLHCSYQDWIQLISYEKKISLLQSEISLVQQTLANLEWMKWWKGIETIIEIICIWYGIYRFLNGDEIPFNENWYWERNEAHKASSRVGEGLNMFHVKKFIPLIKEKK